MLKEGPWIVVEAARKPSGDGDVEALVMRQRAQPLEVVLDLRVQGGVHHLLGVLAGLLDRLLGRLMLEPLTLLDDLLPALGQLGAPGFEQGVDGLELHILQRGQR